jgi:hypothetical protein
MTSETLDKYISPLEVADSTNIDTIASPIGYVEMDTNNVDIDYEAVLGPSEPEEIILNNIVASEDS